MSRLCHTKFKIYDRETTVLIDSGASDNYVAQDFYHNHLLQHGCNTVYLNNTIHIQTAGKRTISLRNPKRVTFQFSSVKSDLVAEISAIVIPRCSPPLVLGCTALSDLNARIIFAPEINLPLPRVEMFNVNSVCIAKHPTTITLEVNSVLPFTGTIAVFCKNKSVKLVQTLHKVYPYRKQVKLQVYTEGEHDLLIGNNTPLFYAVYTEVPTPLLSLAVHKENENGPYFPCKKVHHSVPVKPVFHFQFIGCYSTEGDDINEKDTCDTLSLNKLSNSEQSNDNGSHAKVTQSVQEHIGSTTHARTHAHTPQATSHFNRFALLNNDQCLDDCPAPIVVENRPQISSIENNCGNELCSMNSDGSIAEQKTSYLTTLKQSEVCASKGIDKGVQTDLNLVEVNNKKVGQCQTSHVATSNVQTEVEGCNFIDREQFLSLFPPFGNLSDKDEKALQQLLYEKRDAFFHPSINAVLTPAKVDPVKLVIKPGSPIINKQQYCNFNSKQKKIVHEQLELWVKQGVAGYFAPTELCFISPLVLVPGRKRDTFRLCLNLKKLNTMIIAVQAQVPNIHQLVHVLGAGDGTMYHSYDLASSYLQIPVHPDTWKWLCVRDPITQRIINLKALPFGLVNSGFFLCQAVNTCFEDLLMSMPLTVYVDDLACTSNNENFMHDIEMVLDRLIKNGFKANPEKTRLCKSSLEYLGFLITPNGYSPLPQRVEALSKLDYPNSITALKSFMGMVQYFAAFLPSLGTEMPKLLPLLKKGIHFEFSEEHQQAMDNIVDDLKNCTLLAYADESKDFYVITDSCCTSAAGCLFQYSLNKETNQLSPRPISFCARRLTKAERNYPITQLELLNAVYCISKFSPYFNTTNVHVLTDCKPLLDLYNKIEHSTGRICRNLTYLLSKNVVLHYVQGKDNTIDYLSRATTAPTEEAEVYSYGTLFQGNYTDPDCDPIVYLQQGTVINTPADMAIFTPEQLRQSQSKDPFISQMLLYLQDGTLPGEPKSLIREVTLTSHSYSVIDNLLYKYVDVRTEPKLVIVLPKTLVADILTHFHDRHHPGIKSTLSLLRRRFYWSSMTNDVTQFIRSCDQCAQYKVNPVHRMVHAGTLGIHPPGAVLCLDVAGPFTISVPDRYRYILVFVDVGSRFVTFECLRSLEALSVAGKLINYFFTYGFPETIITDNATYFTSAITSEIIKIFKTTRVMSASYSPFTQGIAERSIQTLKSRLRPIFDNKGHKWPQYVKSIQYSINTVPNDSSKYEPAQLFFGRSLRDIFDVQFPPTPVEIPKNSEDAYQQVLRSLIVSQQLAQQNIREAIAKRKPHTSIPPQYSIGQKVWLLCQDPYSNVKYRGPYLLTEQKSDHVWILRDAATMQQLRSPHHSSHLKPYVDRLSRPQSIVEVSGDIPKVTLPEIPYDDRPSNINSHIPSDNTVQHNIKLLDRLRVQACHPDNMHTADTFPFRVHGNTAPNPSTNPPSAPVLVNTPVTTNSNITANTPTTNIHPQNQQSMPTVPATQPGRKSRIPRPKIERSHPMGLRPSTTAKRK